MSCFRSLPFLVSTAALTVFAGCVREKGRANYVEVNGSDVQFKKIENVHASFAPTGQLSFVAGKPVRLSFALKNIGGRPLRIPEWRMYDVDNVRLFCQPWLPGMSEPDDAAWMSMNEPIRRPELRYALELMPSNQVIVTMELNFAKDLVVSSGAERRYFVRAELNLSSLPMSTGVFVIAIVGR